MTKNEEDVLKGIDLTEQTKSFLGKGEYKAKNRTNRPFGQLSVRDRIKRSLTTGSASMSKDTRNTVEKIKTGTGRAGMVSAAVSLGALFQPSLLVPASILGLGVGVINGVADDMIQRDNKSQAEVEANNLILKNSHNKARTIYTSKDLSELKKIEQVAGSMITRQADWINDVEYEREYEKWYEVIQKAAQKESKLSYPNYEILNMAKAIRLPDYELLNSAKGLSIEKMEEDLFKLLGAQYAARCLRTERENNVWAQPDRWYTGRISYDGKEKTITQKVKCGYIGKEFTDIKYHRDNILNFNELKFGETYTIYSDPNGKAKAEIINDLSLNDDPDRCIVEPRGR